jgi:peptidoglycan hydrolase-like protein with peptidoglycan-binding domain
MFLASKAACAGIVLLLLATGISGPRPTLIASGPNLRNKVPVIGYGNDVKKVQQTLRDKGHYRGDIDGVFGLRTRASIRGFQTAENLPATGQLDPRRPVDSESHQSVTTRLSTRLLKVNLRQAFNGLEARAG